MSKLNRPFTSSDVDPDHSIERALAGPEFAHIFEKHDRKLARQARIAEADRLKASAKGKKLTRLPG